MKVDYGITRASGHTYYADEKFGTKATSRSCLFALAVALTLSPY